MKKILSLIIIIAVPLALFGCGKKDTVPDNIDIRALSDAMIEGLEFGGELEDGVKNLYNAVRRLADEFEAL